MSANAPAKKRSKLCEIKDMGFGEFHDLVGEVVKTYPASFNTLDLYVTDYTTNEDLFLYAEEDDEDLSFMFQKKWPGPKGQMTIAIRLYEPHASFVSNNVHDGDFVYIQNLKTKFSPMNKLEASCQQDQRYPNKIQVHLCTRESQMEPIKKRKEAYEQARGKSGTSGLPAQPKKPSAKAAAKKKQEKKERQRLQRELEEQELKEKLEKIEAGQMNPRIRAGHVDIKRSRIADIINNPERTLKTIVGDHELPYLNCKYRIRVRVIDCFPSQISDMTRSKADPEYCEPSLTDTQKEELEDEFEWFFCLLVEDCDAPVGNENNRLMLTIGDTQGQGLLKMDACNLRDRPMQRREAERKLSALWGNLLDRKQELRQKHRIELPLPTGDERLQLEQQPIDLCIEEFGVPTGKVTATDPEGFTRTWSTFATTVMD